MRRFILLPILTLSVAPALAQQAPQANDEATVTVRGDGTAQVKPDFARLIIAVVTDAADLRDAVNRHQPAATKALALIRSLAIDGVSVERSDFTLNRTVADQPDGGRPETRFVAETEFVLRAARLDKLDSDVTALVDSGLVEVESSRFEADREKAVNLARRAAIKAAEDSAQAYAEAGGFRLGSLMKVLDVTPQTFSAFAGAPLLARAQSGSVALIPPARLTFHASVVVTWRIQSH